MKTFLITIVLLSVMAIGSTQAIARGSHGHHSSTMVQLTTGKGGRVQEELTPEQSKTADRELLFIIGVIIGVGVLSALWPVKS
jgi:hypothetical protein